jgi:hypothetical protein
MPAADTHTRPAHATPVGAHAPERSRSRRAFPPSRPVLRRGTDCQKFLLTPGFDHPERQNRGGLRTQEEGENEYASYHHGAKPESTEAHLQSGVLYQSLGEATEKHEGSGEAESALGSVVPFCTSNSQGPCAHLAAWMHFRRSRVVKAVCAGAAAFAAFQGQCGDDFQKEAYDDTGRNYGTYTINTESTGDGEPGEWQIIEESVRDGFEDDG